MYILLLYARTAVAAVVDAHNEVPGINSRYYTHDNIRVRIKGAYFAILRLTQHSVGRACSGPTHRVHVYILA